MGYSVVKWSVSSKDWEKPGVGKICQNAYHAGNGDILLLHDGDSIHTTVDRSQTVAALPSIIEHYQSLGYEFVTVPAMLNME
jgi:peptidoglycan-N-acetylglucosamine deacetylase